MMKSRARSIVAFLFTLNISAGAAQLSPETVDAWKQYLHTADIQMKTRLSSTEHFMWMDEKPNQRVQVKEGEILVAPVAGHGSIAVPGGLIHDWIGAAFLPDTTIDQLSSVVGDYDHYKDIYAPNVVQSHTVRKGDQEDRFSMLIVSKAAMITVAMNIENEVQRFRVDGNRLYGSSESTAIRQIRNYGHEDQLELGPGEGDGFLWRLYSVSRYEQRDGGVYVELEVIALTRDIPTSLRWLVRPIAARMSRNSLLISLSQMRKALCSNSMLTRSQEVHSTNVAGLPEGRTKLAFSSNGALRTTK